MATTLSAAGRVRDQAAGWVNEQAAYVFGMYAYAFGFPLVMMDVKSWVLRSSWSIRACSIGSAHPLVRAGPAEATACSLR